MSFINFARVLLAALEQGRDATSGQIFLPQEQALSKGNFADFEQVMAAWDRQIRYYTRKSIEIECVVDSVLEENAHDILCSALVDDCIERGKSIKQGGAKYDWVSGLQVGIANWATASRRCENWCSTGAIGQQQLATALAEDFAGLDGEQLRQRLLNAAPKYGNDVDEVDRLLVRAYQTYIEELKQYRNTRFGRGPIGGGYYAGTSSISANVPFGAATLATPDGRKAGAPLAEGASPASGTDHGADGGVQFARQVADRGDPRRRAAQPKAEPGDAGQPARSGEADADVAHLLRELSRLACAVQHRVARNAAGGEATP